jgi:hypothetical protein
VSQISDYPTLRLELWTRVAILTAISLRLWRSTVLAAERRAADPTASKVWPIVKYPVTHHDGSPAFGGRGWCVLSDGRLILETHAGTAVAAVDLSTETKVGQKAVLRGGPCRESSCGTIDSRSPWSFSALPERRNSAHPNRTALPWWDC